MSDTPSVAVLVGSLRANGYSLRLAQALIKLAPERLSLRLVGIGDLPLYNQDLETAPPAPWTAFRQAVREASAVLFVTPEYNRSVPGLLKNAIDVGSRPYGQSVFDRKPAAIVSQSPGAIGGFGANHAIRQSLVFLNMPTLQQPEAYIGNTAGLFGDDGAVKEDATRAFLASFMAAFAAWIDLHAAGRQA
jgi:chromate reductase, NAD(P)H dehydrogenase (quinone)